MQYDPVKNNVMSLINKAPFVRKIFHFALDRLILRQMYVKNMIQLCYPKDSPIFLYDAGAGFCQFSDFVLSKWKNSQVVALDLKAEFLQSYKSYAYQKYGCRFQYVIGDLTEYITKDKCNLILAIDILEHIANDIKVLENFSVSLESGGKLIISTPSDTDVAARFTAEHVRPGYNIEDLKFKLQKAGFKIINVKHSYGFYGKLSWILSMKIPLTLLSISKIMFLILPVYYLILYPLIYVLMLIDCKAKNKSGSGLIVLAEK
jgi:SAM-dependent methyltransferase